MRETILLFHFGNQEQTRRLKMLLLSMKIKIRSVELWEYNTPLGVLAGVMDGDDYPDYQGDDLETEAMIFCGLSHPRLNQVLDAIRKRGIGPIPYKAVLTPTNQHWTISQCYEELKRERAAIQAAQEMRNSDDAGQAP